MLVLFSAPLAAAMLLQAPAPVSLSAVVPPAVDLAAPGPAATMLARADAPMASVLDLGQRPELRLGEPQRVVAQVCRETDDWSAFLTRFDPAAFRAFEFWADEQFLWIKEEFDAPQARLFARRGSLAAAAIAAANSNDRLELEVVVREMHAGRAWIEVTQARWTEEQTPAGTLLHAIRALELMERDGWVLASSQFDRALAPNLPPLVRAELTRLKAECAAEIDALASR
ncbi:hypothetical protein N9Z54_05760 [Planctomycetota bacterium]|nr:hypothetical protein [Planctomycetota bacterium]